MKRLLAGVIVFIVICMIGVVALDFSIDRPQLKDRVIHAIERETGRRVTMAHFSVQVLPWIGLTLRDVSLSSANSPDPLIQAQEVRASVAVIPLLWREIRLGHVDFKHGRLNLTRTYEGGANWRFEPRSDTPQPQVNTPVEKSHRSTMHWTLRLDAARMTDMEICYNDAVRRISGSVRLHDGSFWGLASSAPSFDLHAVKGQTPFHVEGHIGSLSALRDRQGPWDVQINWHFDAQSQTANSLTLSAKVEDLKGFKGAEGTLQGRIAQLSVLHDIFPHFTPPPIASLNGKISFADAGPAAGPSWRDRLRVTSLDLHAGKFLLSDHRQLTSVSLQASGYEAPLTFQGEIHEQGQALKIEGESGPLSQLIQAWHDQLIQPISIQLNVTPLVGLTSTSKAIWGVSDDAVLSISGSVSANAGAFALNFTTKTLHLRSALLHDVALKSDIILPDLDNLTVQNVAFSSREAQGKVEGKIGPRDAPRAQFAIHFTSLNLDALKSLWTPVASESGRQNAETAGSQSDRRDARVVTSTKDPLEETVTARRPIPSVKADNDGSLFDKVRALQVSLQIDALQLDNHSFQNLHVDLSGEGALRRSLLRARQAGAATGPQNDPAATTGEATSRFHLRAGSLVLPSRWLLGLFDTTRLIDGAVQIVGEASADVSNGRVRLQTLSGHLGASMVGGGVSPILVQRYIGKSAASFLQNGQIALRCLAVHADLAPDLLKIDTLGLITRQFALTGSGNIQLAQQSISFHLLPQLRFGGAEASTPLIVSGPLDSPVLAREKDQDGRTHFTIGESEVDRCPALLSIAREGQAGEAAAPMPKEKVRASDLLRKFGLFH